MLALVATFASLAGFLFGWVRCRRCCCPPSCVLVLMSRCRCRMVHNR